MKKFEVVTFENQNIQLYTQDNELIMDVEQLAEAVGFSFKDTFKKFLSNNPELLSEEFSFLRKVNNIEGGIIKKREKRFFNEQGIYEVALLARTERGKSFRKFARSLITKFHKKELLPVNNEDFIRKLQSLDEKFDKLELVLFERQGVIEEVGEGTDKLLNLFEKAKGDLEKISKIEENQKAIIEKIEQIIECTNGIIDKTEELEEKIEKLEKKRR